MGSSNGPSMGQPGHGPLPRAENGRPAPSPPAPLPEGRGVHTAASSKRVSLRTSSVPSEVLLLPRRQLPPFEEMLDPRFHRPASALVRIARDFALGAGELLVERHLVPVFERPLDVLLLARRQVP